MKLFSQFDAVLSAIPLARRLDGKISAGIAQGLQETHIVSKVRFTSLPLPIVSPSIHLFLSFSLSLSFFLLKVA